MGRDPGGGQTRPRGSRPRQSPAAGLKCRTRTRPAGAAPPKGPPTAGALARPAPAGSAADAAGFPDAVRPKVTRNGAWRHAGRGGNGAPLRNGRPRMETRAGTRGGRGRLRARGTRRTAAAGGALRGGLVVWGAVRRRARAVGPLCAATGGRRWKGPAADPATDTLGAGGQGPRAHGADPGGAWRRWQGRRRPRGTTTTCAATVRTQGPFGRFTRLAP